MWVDRAGRAYLILPRGLGARSDKPNVVLRGPAPLRDCAHHPTSSGHTAPGRGVPGPPSCNGAEVAVPALAGVARSSRRLRPAGSIKLRDSWAHRGSFQLRCNPVARSAVTAGSSVVFPACSSSGGQTSFRPLCPLSAPAVESQPPPQGIPPRGDQARNTASSIPKRTLGSTARDEWTREAPRALLQWPATARETRRNRDGGAPGRYEAIFMKRE